MTCPACRSPYVSTLGRISRRRIVEVRVCRVCNHKQHALSGAKEKAS